jgi:hypothetical protein
MTKARIVDLCDEEVRYIGARDEPGGPVARIDQHTICARARPVGQDGRTNNRPAEPAPADDLTKPTLDLSVIVGQACNFNTCKSMYLIGQ